MTEQDKPSRGEQLRKEQMEHKARRNRWMLGMLAGGLTIIVGIGLLLHQSLFDEFNQIFFGICAIIGGGMIAAGSIFIPDKSTNEDDAILDKLRSRQRIRYGAATIPLPTLLAIIGVLFVVSGIVTLIRG